MTYSDLLILILIANLAETILQVKFALCKYYIHYSCCLLLLMHFSKIHPASYDKKKHHISLLLEHLSFISSNNSFKKSSVSLEWGSILMYNTASSSRMWHCCIYECIELLATLVFWFHSLFLLLTHFISLIVYIKHKQN